MPPVFVPCDGIAEVTAVFTMGGVQSANVFHMDHHPGPLNVGNLGAIAQDVILAITAHLEKHLSHDVGLLKVKLRDLTTEFSTEIEQSVPGNGGTGTSPAVSPNTALLIKWTTGLVGRNFRGRSFLMGLPADKVSETGDIDGAWYTDIVNDAIDFTTALSPGAVSGAQLCVTSKRNNKAPRAAGVSTPIIGSVVRTMVHSQRRRQRVLG